MNSNIPIELADSKLKLVEELGVLHEQGGMQAAAARILSLLLVADQIELTFEEIYETLNLSKSATSNALNFLLSTREWNTSRTLVNGVVIFAASCKV